MKIILLGPPGAGKGTQAQFIKDRLNIPQISTGEMLRTAVSSGNELGQKVKAVMESGALVSDEIIIDLVTERIAQADCANGFLFDGFPRTIPQAQALKAAQVDIDAVVEIRVEEDELVKRITGRRVHPGSGRVYHVEYNPPNVPDKDDETGEPLLQREDDSETTVRERFAVYHRQTVPLIGYYKGQKGDRTKYVGVDGRGTVAEISERINAALEG